MRSLQVAVAMFTALPVPRSWHDRVTPRAAVRSLAWLPFVGALLGGLAGLPVAAVVGRDHGLGLLAAVLGLATLALLTRGLHLDGLADTADGLGSRAEPERALAIMRQSDIGPFGVSTLVFVLLADCAALAAIGADSVWSGTAALAVAAATGRLAVLQAAAPNVPAARDSGFGALVAGGTGRGVAVTVTAVVLAAGTGLAVAVHANPIAWPAAQVIGLLAAGLLRRHATRRFGGVTGDVFGALVEAATLVTLVGVAVTLR
jgi:adenosylcobinamide-GDP ribazoletransferase